MHFTYKLQDAVPFLWLQAWTHEQGDEDFWASRKQPQEEEEVVAS